MPHYVASDLGLHCLPMTLYGFQVRMGKSIPNQVTEPDIHSKTVSDIFPGFIQGYRKTGIGTFTCKCVIEYRLYCAL